MFATRITRLLGIERPVICGCMQWLTKAEMVAAVAEAGGMGIIPAAAFETIEQIRQEIRKTRALTTRPFAVNVTLLPMGRPFSHEEMLQAAIDEGVGIIETAGHNPQELVPIIKRAGAKHMHKCARVRDALKVEKLGADMVTVVGFECGGHPGRQDVSTMVKVAKAASVLTIPVAAGGGIVDGRGLIAALAIGAEAVVMGTRFMATRECPMHQGIKERLLAAEETDTALAMTSLEPARGLKNRVLAEVVELERKGAGISEIYPLVAGQRGLAAYQSGDADDALIPCGQGVGLISDVPTIAELLDRIMAEAEDATSRLSAIASAAC
jgi:nitronate monooxygenase